MWKLLVIACLSYQIMICKVSSKAIEAMAPASAEAEDESTEPVEVPIKIGPIRSSSGDTLSIFKLEDDHLLGFLDKVANVSYATSQVALNRMKEHTANIRQIRGQVENFLEKLPTFPIPILDDMSRVRLLN
ncbi:hypothetical protein NQ315_002426 [Exocentrus adspersus]|uniref:Uncharacterized protein n=1 Tax=Exocentrus adspersus TaxID=1586481 RepID=A0AAV8VSU2_9CUCU|nr:hypothetical protein NQ315_002426 [Exocentrus adspersus]